MQAPDSLMTFADEIYETNSEIAISPNPFSNFAVLYLPNGEQSAKYELTLFDMLGRELPVDFTRNENSFVIEKGSLNAGVFLLSLKSRDKTYIQKIILQPE